MASRVRDVRRLATVDYFVRNTSLAAVAFEIYNDDAGSVFSKMAAIRKIVID